jgi:hypothetical protein
MSKDHQTPSSGMGPGLISYTRSEQHLTCMHRADGDRQFIVLTFLGGPTSRRTDGDAAAAVAKDRKGLLDLKARSQTHLSRICAYGGILLPFAVRSYLCRKKLPRQASRQPGLCPGALWSAFASHRPHQPGDHISMQRRSYARGRQMRHSCPPFHFPHIGGRRSSGALYPRLFAACLAVH